MKLLYTLFIIGTLLISCTYAAVEFQLVTDQAPWVARKNAGLFTMPVSMQIDELYIPKGAFIILGGDRTGGTVLNDIWMSTNAKDWTMISGKINGQSPPGAGAPYGGSSFNGGSETSFAMDPANGFLYRVGGDNLNDLWVSDNVVQWRQITNSKYPGRNYAGVTVDSTGKVIVAGGYKGGKTLADVWTSTDKGRSFEQAIGFNENSTYANFGAAPWGGNVNGVISNYNTIGGRGVMDFGNWRDPRNGQDYQYVWTGSSEPHQTFNDVWVSGDSGQSWHVVCKAAPWVARNDDTGGITPSGILVVAAGRASRIGGTDQPPLNDVWASLDGGHTWGRCGESAFSGRRYPSSVFDSAGYMYVMAGVNSTDINDVWKSSFSFDDANAVAQHCNLKMPPCGVGLVCFPGSARVDAEGIVRCPTTDQCADSSSGGGSSSAVAALAVLFVISTVIAAYAIFYIYRSKKNAQANHINSSDSLGNMSGSNDLYKPLTIHS